MAMIAGALLDIGGNAMLGESAEDHINKAKQVLAKIKDPDYAQLAKNYFADLNANYDTANTLSSKARSDELTQDLALREQALPGITKALRDSMSSISPLLRGELPQGVMDSYMRAGGASTVGSGFGGSQFGALNTGLFGARGSLGAIETGMGLLPRLLASMPSISAPTTMGLLNQITNPTMRAQLGLQVQQSRTNLDTQIAGMPTRLDVWGQGMKQAGGMLMGSGMMGGMGMGGGGATGGTSGGAGFMGNGGATGMYSNMGAAGAYGGGGNSNIWGNPYSGRALYKYGSDGQNLGYIPGSGF